MVSRKVIPKIYNKYKYGIFPKLKDVRGSTRLLGALREFSELGVRKVEEEPEPLYAKEWDNVIILDACRFDLYQEVVGESEYRITVGSSSQEFIKNTFSQSKMKDTVCVTANPHYNPADFREYSGKDLEEVFHSVFDTYRTDWNNEQGTVMPQKILRDVKTADKLFPDKNKLVHMMQPHHPFINSELPDSTAHPSAHKGQKVWARAAKGEISKKDIWPEYRKNLEYVLSTVKEMAEFLEGDTFVTADHGNFVGENNLYGHPSNSEAQVLRKVPWDKFN